MAGSDPDRDDVKRLVRRHWDDRAETFDEQPEHGIHSDAQRARWLAVLEQWTPDEPRRALDVGCGTGVLALLLAELGHDVVGFDAAHAMVQQARRKTGDRAVEVALGDATRLGVADDAVGIAVERHLLWTLPDPGAALAEWRRVVAPGGRIVCFEGQWDHDEPRGEYEMIHGELPGYDGWSRDSLAGSLADAGLVDVEAAPLADPVLRGRKPEDSLPHDYVVAAGTVPR